jgi:hypothetical protein
VIGSLTSTFSGWLRALGKHARRTAARERLTLQPHLVSRSQLAEPVVDATGTEHGVGARRGTGADIIWTPCPPSCWRWPTRRCSRHRRSYGSDPRNRPGRVAKDKEAKEVRCDLTPCMPCSFGFLQHARSGAYGHAVDSGGVTVADRCTALVTAACGTWVARPARTTTLPPGSDGSQLGPRVRPSSVTIA